MIYSKKAIESYLFIVLGMSLIFSVLLFFIIQLAYQSDAPICQELTYDYEVQCKSASGFALSIHNTGSKLITFELNGDIEDNYYFEPGAQRRITVQTEDSTAVAIPYIYDENNMSHMCISKREKTSLEVLGSC